MTRDIPLTVFGGRLTVHVKALGHGDPLVYFHPAAGLALDPFVQGLAARYTVYAPEFPGTSTGDPYAVHQVDDVWDLVLVYEEVIRGLSAWGCAAVGASFGGMLAAEVAATFPDAFGRLVLLDPLGLWRADQPVANWISAAPAELAGLLFHDATGPAARAALDPSRGPASSPRHPSRGPASSPRHPSRGPEDPDAAVEAIASAVWSTGCTGKFVWPIPDRGLAKRLHRIAARTLIVWGEQDRLAPVRYAEEFRSRIAGAEVAIIPDSGHLPQVEQCDLTQRAVTGFLAR